MQLDLKIGSRVKLKAMPFASTPTIIDTFGWIENISKQPG